MGDMLCLDHALMYRDGLLRETFVRGCRQFAKAVEKGLDRVDPQGSFILPPGKSEAKDKESEGDQGSGA